MTETRQAEAWKDLGFQETFLAYFRDEKADALRLLATMLVSFMLESRESRPHEEMRGPYRHWRAIGRDLWGLQTTLLGIAEALVEPVWGLPDDVANHLAEAAKLRARRSRRDGEAVRVGGQGGDDAMSGTAGELSRALAILRISHGWNQDQLARAAGVTSSALSEYERGKKIPELKTVWKLLEALGYPLSALERTHDFLRELQAEALLEAQETAEGGHVLLPLPAKVDRAATLRARARRTAALVGQAATSFGLLLLDVLIEISEAESRRRDDSRRFSDTLKP